MKKMSALVLCILSANSWAVKLTDYKPFKFEPLFTNPVCETYSYDRPLITEGGKTVTAKPKNVYCKPSDESTSVSRSTSPQYRIVEWISDKDTKELYMAYLSFSSKNVTAALCTAVKKGVKVSIVLDGGEDNANPVLNPSAESLKKCGDANLVSVTYRGTTSGLGYAHNKILMVNPGAKLAKILYSSGNMTSGTSINHENWNFITTSGESYFAQAHKCVIEAMITAGDTKTNFAKSLNTCRSKISAEQETDIQVFFSPVDGAQALAKVTEAGNKAKLIEAMSHRFSGQLAALYMKLLADKKPIKFILDDDIYWSVKRKEDIGRNTSIEAFKIYKDLINKGMETKFLQTNQSVFQLQHNKFMIFTFASGGAVFNGAGNFTTAAFTKNFENFYYITIPEVVEAYNKQYDLYFDQMATSEADMPRDYVLP
jgi:HKD family nuclease